MCSLGDTLQPALGINPALSHLFRLRKIQANIRRSREALPCHDLVGDFKSRLSLFKPALDSWRQDIPQNALNNVQCGYLHPIWMQKLYDYSLLILGEGTREFTEMDGMKDMVAAIVDVCLNFRMLQEEGHVMCYTWSAVSVNYNHPDFFKYCRSHFCSSFSSSVQELCFSILLGRQNPWLIVEINRSNSRFNKLFLRARRT